MNTETQLPEVAPGVFLDESLDVLRKQATFFIKIGNALCECVSVEVTVIPFSGVGSIIIGSPRFHHPGVKYVHEKESLALAYYEAGKWVAKFALGK